MLNFIRYLNFKGVENPTNNAAGNSHSRISDIGFKDKV